MKQTFFFFFFILILTSLVFVSADEEEIEQGRQIVDEKSSCNNLTDEQLVAVGEYYMELMHPGTLHDAMHTFMGLEEETQEHDQFHINLAKQIYCGERNYNMIGYNNGYAYGMMGMMYGTGGWNSSYSPVWNIVPLIFTALIFALIFWVLYLLLKKENRRKRRK